METRGHYLDSILAENDNIFFKYRICKKNCGLHYKSNSDFVFIIDKWGISSLENIISFDSKQQQQQQK